ncbi:MAG TPA: efflux RND transporter permease subunit [Thioploca sp.]|nr:MAG: acriflavin resistance protein [Beggiatoa sp. 4572_84]RKZ53105.1 MAG: AcrB/AcrD/AcrF family protein [Gammaproteobacteria bacterium]HDN27565.1 efflux RND transporter permease subunit [Thioploca sp.]
MPKQRFTRGGLAAWSVYHPIGVVMIALAVVVLGLFSLHSLGIDLLPHLIYPEIRVRVLDPGVPTTVMEDQVTRQLEEQLAITEDAIGVQSQTSEGRSSVDLSFAYGKDIDIALRDASTRLDRAKRFLPDTIQPPIIYKRDPSQIPVLILAVSSRLRDPVELRTWVDKQLSKWFINLPGVAAAEVGGGLVREIQVLPDQQRLVALGLSLEDVVNALKQANVESAGGRLYMSEQEISTRVLGRWQRVEDIAAVRLSPKIPTTSPPFSNGGIGGDVFLGEIAQIIDTHQDERLRVLFNSIPGIKLSIQKQPQANTVAVVDTVQERMTWLKEQRILPADVQLDVVDNQAVFVRHALKNATYSALTGAALAMLVVFLFLGHLRQTLIIGTAIPLAITVTFILMAWGGLTLNIMTLGGLALGVGMVVDNTIVMLENITRHQQHTDSPTDGAINAVGEITSAIVAATTTNLAAIVPFLFIVGLVGLLFRELIFTISAAMVASLVVALTVVPALAGRVKRKAHRPPLEKKNTGGFGLLRPIEFLLKLIYVFLMKHLLLRWPLSLLIIAVFCVGLWYSFPTFLTGKQIFLPDLDDGRVSMRITAEPGIALQEMDNIVMQIENMLQQQPEVESVFTHMGGFIFGRSQYEMSHRSSLNVQLVPLTQRTLSTNNWIKQMNKKLKKLQLVGVKVRMRSAGIRGIRLGRSDDDFSLRLQGNDLPTLTHLADELLERFADVPGLLNLKHSAEEVRQELAVVVDRQRADALGFTAQDVGRDLNILMNGRVVTDFIEGDQSIDVRLRLPRSELQNPQDLQSVLLYNKEGMAVRLDEITKVQWIPVPAEIMRENQQRIIEISGNLSTESSLLAVMAQVQQRLADFHLPEGYALYEGGAAEALQESQQLTQILLGLAVFLVFVVMAVQYESLRNPLVILVSIPFVTIGVAVGIVWLEMPLSMPVWLGMIMLAGIVVNNAIVLVETIELQRAAGLSVQAAILAAGELRLRPILMTTLTTVMGLLPLALGWGEGAKMLQPLALTIVFGLSFSLLVSLLLVPLCYQWLAKMG